MILVTGGTGLLGSHLLLELVSSGKKVRATRRKESNIAMVEKIFSYYTDDPSTLLSSIEWFDADLLDVGAMENALEGVTEVYHCAALVSFYPKDHKSMMKVNVECTANLVNLCLERKIEKFCYVSSIATLGRADNDGLTDEESYWKTSRKNSVYAISKYGAEREVWRAMEEGLPAVIVNPAVILGPGFWDGNSGLFRLVYKGLKYYTQGVNGYVAVRDVAKAMILVMEKNLFNNRFLLSADNLSYQVLFALMAKHLHKPAPSVNVPPFMSGIAWRIEYLRSLLMHTKAEISKEMAVTSTQQYTYSNDKIRKVAGFRFTPIEESIKEICTFYLKDKN